MTEPLQATPVPVFDKKDIEDNRLIAAISYISLLCLIPLLLKKDSKFCQEHGRQGFIVFLLSVVTCVLGWVPVLGWFVLAPLGSILVFIISVVGFVKALQGEFWEIPVIGKYRKQVNF